MNRTLALLALALLAAACSKEDEVAPPAELVDFDPLVRVERVWSAGTKGGDDVLRLGLRPAVDGDRVYVAGHGGDVQALTVADGKSLWRIDTELELSGGPAVGARSVTMKSPQSPKSARSSIGAKLPVSSRFRNTTYPRSLRRSPARTGPRRASWKPVSVENQISPSGQA